MTPQEIKVLWKKTSSVQERDFVVADMLAAEKDLKDNAVTYIGILLTTIDNLREELANFDEDREKHIAETIRKFNSTVGVSLYSNAKI